jgi:hypothetical protein
MVVQWLNHSDAPAWAQAGVSAMAIVVGASAIWWQVRRQRIDANLQRRDDDVRRLSIVASSIFECRVLCEQMLEQIRAGYDIRHSMDELQMHRDRLSDIPPLELPDVDAASAIAGSIFAIYQLDGALAVRRALNRPATDTRQNPEEWQVPWLNVAIDNLRGHEETLRSTLRRRDADVPDQVITLNDVHYFSLSATRAQAQATPTR